MSKGRPVGGRVRSPAATPSKDARGRCYGSRSAAVQALVMAAESERTSALLSPETAVHGGASSLVANLLQVSYPTGVPAHRHAAVRHVAPCCGV